MDVVGPYTTQAKIGVQEMPTAELGQVAASRDRGRAGDGQQRSQPGQQQRGSRPR